MHWKYKEVDDLDDRLRDEKDQHMSSSSSGEQNRKNEVEALIQGIWLRFS